MQLFFLVSGFVIFLTVLKSKSVFDFVYKRFTRLYPTFIFCLVTTFTIVMIFGLPQRQRSLYQALGNLTMMTNVFGFKPVDGAYWTLEIEVAFYLFMAALMFFHQVKNILFWGVVYISLVWVSKFLYSFTTVPSIFLNCTWSPLFFAGILFYKIKSEGKALKNKLLIHFLVALCYITSCLYLPLLPEKIIVFLFFVLFYFFSFEKLNWLHSEPLLFVGGISYPLYLIHQNIGYVIMNHTKQWLGNYPLIFIGLTIALAITIAFLIHQFIEKPSIKYLRGLKKKYFDF